MSDFQMLMLIFGIVFFLVGIAVIFIDFYRPKEEEEEEEEKDIADMTYEEFSLYILNHDLIPYITYDAYEIYHLNGRYFYYGCYEWLDSNEFYEVRQIACLMYTDMCDIKRGAALISMFDCDHSGEAVTDDGIYYCWFKKVGEPDDTI